MNRREFFTKGAVVSAGAVAFGLMDTEQAQAAEFAGLDPKVAEALRRRIEGLRDLPSVNLNATLAVPTDLANRAPAERIVALAQMLPDALVTAEHGKFSHHWAYVSGVQNANQPETFAGGITVRDPKGYGLEAGTGTLADGVTNTGFLSLVARHPGAENEFNQFRGETNADSHGLYLLGTGFFDIRYIWGDLSQSRVTGYVLGDMVVAASEFYAPAGQASVQTKELTGELFSPSFQLIRYRADGSINEPLGVIAQVEASKGQYLGIHTGPGSFSDKFGGPDEFSIGWAFDRN